MAVSMDGMTCAWRVRVFAGDASRGVGACAVSCAVRSYVLKRIDCAYKRANEAWRLGVLRYV